CYTRIWHSLSTLFPYTTLFRSKKWGGLFDIWVMTAYQMFFGGLILLVGSVFLETSRLVINSSSILILLWLAIPASIIQFTVWFRSEEHTSELQSRENLVCRLLL